MPAEQVITGRITDEQGSPVANAVIEPEGIRQGRFYSNRTEAVDAMAVSDANGQFRIGLRKPCEIRAKVAANGYCPKQVRDLKSGQENLITLDEGVTVEGYVTLHGKPLPHAGVGLVQQERGDNYIGYFEIDTDENGFFQFVNVPSNEKMFFYGLMESMKKHGCVPSVELTTGEVGSTLTLETAKISPAFTVKGRVRFDDGQEIPERMRVLLSRENAWDTQIVILDREGRFEFTGIPPEQCVLVANYSGYRMSRANKSLSPINPFRLIGVVDRDLSDIEVLLEPGPWLSLQDFSREERSKLDQLRRNPIRGAE